MRRQSMSPALESLAMYQQHFGLNSAPFSIAPDPRFLYMSERHREALAHLLHGIGGQGSNGGGFILLTGEVGTGKTTLCRCLLEQLPEHVRLAYVLNPRLSPIELLQTVCDELRIAAPDNVHSLKQLTDAVTQRLIENHRRGLNTVLMIDEAQQLSTEALEQVRLLTNLETTEKKLLQIILIGQPELQERLAQTELRQLAQRITARYHLLPLNLNETASYVLHRLQIASAASTPLRRSPFTSAALRSLQRYSGGIPRLVNTISERALLGGFAKNREQIDEKMLRQAALETLGPIEFGRRTPGSMWRTLSHVITASGWRGLAAMAFVLISVTALLTIKGQLFANQPQAMPVAVAEQSPAQTPPRAADKTTNVSAVDEAVTNASSASLLPSASASTVSNRSTASDVTHTSLDRRDQLVDTMLKDYAPDRQGDAAARALFARWHVDFYARRDGASCDFASAHQLRCEAGYADWLQLIAQNYPAVVSLQSPQRGPFSALVVALRADRAIVQISTLDGSASKTREIELARTDFESLWNGEYFLLWPAPFAFNQPLSQGSSGAAVLWLAQALQQTSAPDFVPGSHFDAQLAQQLKTFQQQYHLVPDAMAGSQTLMALASRRHPQQPRLDGLSSGF